jgi:hypothetical protein
MNLSKDSEPTRIFFLEVAEVIVITILWSITKFIKAKNPPAKTPKVSFIDLKKRDPTKSTAAVIKVPLCIDLRFHKVSFTLSLMT